MKQPSYPCSCIVCKKSYSSLGIDTHFMRSHGNEDEKRLFEKATLSIKSKSKKIQKIYLENPNNCKWCNKILEYNKRHNLFCGPSCRAKQTNSERIKNGYSLSPVSRDNIRFKLAKIVGPYSKVRFQSCKFCQTYFRATTTKTVCDNCQHLKWYNNKDQYSFKFNVFDYPDLFDLGLLSKVGWVSFGGKRGGQKNPNGLSRDHKVSVNEAKLKGHDPYYISHPCNCQLIPMDQNNKKKTKSSISFSELVKMVDEYDKSRGGH